jgi:hypothetical protein
MRDARSESAGGSPTGTRRGGSASRFARVRLGRATRNSDRGLLARGAHYRLLRRASDDA